MECLWYLCGKVPSIQTPGRTILDETHEANVKEPIYSHYRLMHKQGQLYPSTGRRCLPGRQSVDKAAHDARVRTEGVSLGDWFSPEFTRSVF